MKTALCPALALVLLFVFAQPAVTHQFEPKDPEPDHVVFVFAVVLYPLADLLDHFLCRPHEQDEGETEDVVEEQEPKKPKYNFSSRKKQSQEDKEESP